MWLLWTSKTPCSRTSSGNQRVHGLQTLLKSARHHYYPIAPWIGNKLIWRISASLKFEILGLIVNRLTADDKYSRRNIQNLTQQLQTAISQKQKTISGTFITYLKSRTNWDNFEKKDVFSSLSISEVIDAEKGGYLNV